MEKLEKDVSEAEQLGESAIELGVATATLPLKRSFWHRVFVLALWIIAGYVLLYLRFEFFRLVPLLKAMVIFVAFTWNTFLQFIDLFRPMLQFLSDVLDNLFNLIMRLIPDNIAGGAKILLTMLFENLRLLQVLLTLNSQDDSFSAADVNNYMDDIVKNCHPFIDGWDLVRNLVRQQTHSTMCSTARYLYPVPWLYASFTYLFGSFYRGSAVPIVNHYAEPGTYNCEADKFEEVGLPSQTCAVIASGFVVLEVIVPIAALLILGLLISEIFDFIFRLFAFIFSLTEFLIERLLLTLIRYAL